MEGHPMLNTVNAGTHFNPQMRGYHAVYRENAVNHCPGCGRTHWLIGRMLAECGFCSTALPLSESYMRGSSSLIYSRGGKPGASLAA
jgi:hypothetical protein